MSAEKMTPMEWNVCTTPVPMLAFLHNRISERKLRLFACACCRRIWPLLNDARTRSVILTAERYADGLVCEEDCRAAQSAAADVLRYSSASLASLEGPLISARRAATFTTSYLGDADGLAKHGAFHAALFSAEAYASGQASVGDPGRAEVGEAEARLQCSFLRDLVGNPFQPVAIDSAWQTPNAITLAQAAYDYRNPAAGTLDPTRLAILADALEDAGCSDVGLLEHLRGAGPHVRGCFAVDAVLGKG
jgi:hypothetical protein